MEARSAVACSIVTAFFRKVRGRLALDAHRDVLAEIYCMRPLAENSDRDESSVHGVYPILL